jgi:hypothetical protein
MPETFLSTLPIEERPTSTMTNRDAELGRQAIRDGSIKNRVAFAFGHIGAIKAQKHWVKDDIIADHVDPIYDTLEALLKDLYREERNGQAV